MNTIAAIARERRDELIDDWHAWRDCQHDNDANKQLVDDVYSSFVSDMDFVIDYFTPLVQPDTLIE